MNFTTEGSIVREADIVRGFHVGVDDGHGIVDDGHVVAGGVAGHWEGCMPGGKVRHRWVNDAMRLCKGATLSLL